MNFLGPHVCPAGAAAAAERLRRPRRQRAAVLGVWAGLRGAASVSAGAAGVWVGTWVAARMGDGSQPHGSQPRWPAQSSQYPSSSIGSPPFTLPALCEPSLCGGDGCGACLCRRACSPVVDRLPLTLPPLVSPSPALRSGEGFAPHASAAVAAILSLVNSPDARSDDNELCFDNAVSGGWVGGCVWGGGGGGGALEATASDWCAIHTYGKEGRSRQQKQARCDGTLTDT